MHKRGILLMTGIMSISVILTGCFQGEQSQEKMDPPQDATAVNNTENVTTEENTGDNTGDANNVADAENEAVTETVMRQLFLIDANGMVAPQTIEIPRSDSKEVAEQALEYMVEGGPVTNLLPNGFQAVLPAGTEILSLNLKNDGTMIVDVSKEFKNYKAENELKILQAMTYTLTQFDTVNKVQLWINGQPQEAMPVNGTPIGDGYSRANGINVTDTDTVDLIDSKAVTMYYPTEFNESEYYVPVTQYINADDKNYYQSVVKALFEGPGYDVNTKLVFNQNVSLAAEPILQSGVLELVFNKGILKDAEKTTISDEVMETIVRTMTAQQDVKAVKVNVENVEKIFNEEGEEYNKPVTTEMLSPTKKL